MDNILRKEIMGNICRRGFMTKKRTVGKWPCWRKSGGKFANRKIWKVKVLTINLSIERDLRRFKITTDIGWEEKTMEHQNEEKIHGKKCNAMVRNLSASTDIRSSLWMRSNRMVRTSDRQCRSRNCSGFDPSILWYSNICGAADKAALNKVLKK